MKTKRRLPQLPPQFCGFEELVSSLDLFYQIPEGKSSGTIFGKEGRFRVAVEYDTALKRYLEIQCSLQVGDPIQWPKVQQVYVEVPAKNPAQSHSPFNAVGKVRVEIFEGSFQLFFGINKNVIVASSPQNGRSNNGFSNSPQRSHQGKGNCWPQKPRKFTPARPFRS